MHSTLRTHLQGRQFDVVLDANVFHCFAPGPDRDAYVANLARLVKPGERCSVLWCGSEGGDQPGWLASAPATTWGQGRNGRPAHRACVQRHSSPAAPICQQHS